jgi:hypothetical protein
MSIIESQDFKQFYNQNVDGLKQEHPTWSSQKIMKAIEKQFTTKNKTQGRASSQNKVNVAKNKNNEGLVQNLFNKTKSIHKKKSTKQEREFLKFYRIKLRSEHPNWSAAQI